MKKAVAYLEPFMEDEKDGSESKKRGTMVIATVKGDVHDIGKNIVGVVLACNNWDVIDLGVMVSCDKILDSVAEHGADVLGLSGLITPSLDEMIHNAKEMERLGLKIPLLIGGATTSRAHTAIKITQHYSAPVIQVPDASLVVNVCNDVLHPKKSKAYIEALETEQTRIREQHEAQGERPLLKLDEARAKGLSFDWEKQEISEPLADNLGTHHLTPSLEEVLEFFDWSPFFWAWELKGTYPQIFDKKNTGEEARKLYDHAQELLEDIIGNKRFICQAMVGIWPAHSLRDDVELFTDLSKKKSLGAFRFVRRQQVLPNQSQFCLSDFVAPKDSKRMDYLGAFAVSAGDEVDQMAEKYKVDNDDYTSILIKSLGDRFAEATAEYAHKIVRDLWGFGKTEGLTNEELIAEKYRGIRPAAGYPCQPDHTEKDLIWNLLDVEKHIGLELTESRAMNPGCSVSGLYFSHPEAKYFNVGSLGRDQVEDYAARKGWTFEKAVKWLRPNLGFDA